MKSAIAALVFVLSASASAADIVYRDCDTAQEKLNAAMTLKVSTLLKNWELDAIEAVTTDDYLAVNSCLPTDAFCTAEGTMTVQGAKVWRQVLGMVQTAYTPNEQFPDAFYLFVPTAFTCLGDDTVIMDVRIEGKARGMTAAFRSRSHQVWKWVTDSSGALRLRSNFAFWEDKIVSPAWTAILNPPASK